MQGLLQNVGMGTGMLGTGAALHGAGLGSLFEPLDYPRQALWNLVQSGGRALSGQGTWEDLLRAAPGALGTALAGGLIASGAGAPLGVLAGSALGGLGQGIGKAADEETFQAPAISDLTGTDDFLTNLGVGVLTDPLTYAGGLGAGAAGGAIGKKLGKSLAKPGAVDDYARALESVPPATGQTIADPQLFQANYERALAETLPAQVPDDTVLRQLDELEALAARDAAARDEYTRALESVQPATAREDDVFSQLKTLDEARRRRAPKTMLRGPAPDELTTSGVAETGPSGLTEEILGDIPATLPDELGFYSRLERAILGLPDRLPAQDAANILRKGMSAEELAWTGLDKPLKSKGMVTRDEILDKFNENRIEVKEVMRRRYSKAEEDEFNELQSIRFPTPEQAHRLRELRINITPRPRWEGFQSPGGENYREILLTMPVKGKPILSKSELDELNHLQSIRFPEPAQAARLAELEARFDAAAIEQHSRTNMFQSEHWSEPNVLAHVRFKDRTGPRGEKILHIEEVQSDWHQEGRKVGYQGQPPKYSPEEIKALEDRARAIEAEMETFPEFELSPGPRYDQLDDELRGIEQKLSVAYADPVPDAPFKSTWHEMAMKRMFRYAAENNYDGVAWSQGADVWEALQRPQGPIDDPTKTLRGMRKFYNDILPRWVTKFAKKQGWDINLRQSIASPNTPARWQFGMTPEMRKDILYRGMPLLSLVPPAALALAQGGGLQNNG